MVANSEVTQFWSYFRIAGESPGTREDVQMTCESLSMSDSAIYHEPKLAGALVNRESNIPT
jgi:hypothetical protein